MLHSCLNFCEIPGNTKGSCHVVALAAMAKSSVTPNVTTNCHNQILGYWSHHSHVNQVCNGHDWNVDPCCLILLVDFTKPIDLCDTKPSVKQLTWMKSCCFLFIIISTHMAQYYFVIQKKIFHIYVRNSQLVNVCFKNFVKQKMSLQFVESV